MIDVTPQVGRPLPSEELKKDARAAGIEGDESTKGKGDTHLPASESGQVGELGGEESQARPAVVPPPD